MFIFHFFEPHHEHKIGIKVLSDADLGISTTSHQTHIGLMQDVLQYLPNTDIQAYSMLIYNNKSEMLNCYFDRIKNPDGSFRSPKIRISDDPESVVCKIREYTSASPNNIWYLLWMGLKGDELVFWLFNNKSEDYKQISKLVNITGHVIVDETNKNFNGLLHLVSKHIDRTSMFIMPDLEIASQTTTHKKFNHYDIENAKRHFQKVGKIGEQLINEYLDKQIRNGEIHDFEWMNRSRESALPFDFIINNGTPNCLYMDVKSTQYAFEQPLVFSSQEVTFAKGTNHYNVYRVYEIDTDGRCGNLKICNQCNSYMNNLGEEIDRFKNAVEEISTEFRGASLAVVPSDNVFKEISKSIILKEGNKNK